MGLVRRIGLDRSEGEVPVRVAAKLTRQTEGYSLGLLDVQTGDEGDLDSENLFVGRVSKNVLEQSNVGLLWTHGDPAAGRAGRDDDLALGEDRDQVVARISPPPPQHVLEVAKHLDQAVPGLLALLAAAGLSGVAFLVNETVVLQAERAWRQHLSGAEDDIEFRRGSFWYATGNLIYNVGNADPDKQVLHNLRIFEKDDNGRLLRRIYAGLARAKDGDLELFDATEIRFHPEDPRSVPEKTWSSQLLLDTNAASSNPTLLEADATTLALPSLHEFISQRAAAGGDVSRFVSLFHSRFTNGPPYHSTSLSVCDPVLLVKTDVAFRAEGRRGEATQ